MRNKSQSKKKLFELIITDRVRNQQNFKKKTFIKSHTYFQFVQGQKFIKLATQEKVFKSNLDKRGRDLPVITSMASPLSAFFGVCHKTNGKKIGKCGKKFDSVFAANTRKGFLTDFISEKVPLCDYSLGGVKSDTLSCFCSLFESKKLAQNSR